MSGSTAALEAAVSRAQGMTERGCTRASRPTKRRSVEEGRGGGMAGPEAVRAVMVLRDAGSGGDGTVRFEGMASVYEPADHGLEGHVCRGYQMWDMFGMYTEYVHLGAGTASLANPQLEVPFVVGHDSLRRLALTNLPAAPLELSEVNDGDLPGLRVVAPSISRENPVLQDVEYALTSGLINETDWPDLSWPL